MGVFIQTVQHEIQAIDLYECGSCGNIHDCEDAAGECCRPVTYDTSGYRCLNCEKYYTKKKEALDCCTKEILLCTSCKKEVEADGRCCPDLFINKEVSELARR